MAVDERLARKGRKEPREGLAQQAKVSAGLAKEHALELDGAGWPASDTTKLEAGYAYLESKVAKQADDKGGASSASDEEQAAIDGTKAFVRRLRNALPRVLRETKVAIAPDAFNAGVRLGRSTPKLSAFLTRIRPGVLALDPDLASFFGGKSAVGELDAAKLRLDTADTTQEVALSALPVATQEVYEAKGRVLELIEDLNRAGRTAFDGDAVMMAKFNKGLVTKICG
jgi:hypothetical protein